MSKGIWIVIIVLGVILIAVLFWPNKEAATTGSAAGAGAGATDPLMDAMVGLVSSTTGTTNCRRDCDNLCASVGLFSGRGKCKDGCLSDCTAGKPYKTLWPQ